MFQTKVVEKLETHFMFNFFFFFRNHAVYEITWKIIAEPGRPQITIWRIRIACWITKATNTHTGYVILIALPLHQWLKARASVLCYTYISCFVKVLQEFFIFMETEGSLPF
jgi:hypothetical protein